jgi:hypothetical protein
MKLKVLWSEEVTAEVYRSEVDLKDPYKPWFSAEQTSDISRDRSIDKVAGVVRFVRPCHDGGKESPPICCSGAHDVDVVEHIIGAQRFLAVPPSGPRGPSRASLSG